MDNDFKFLTFLINFVRFKISEWDNEAFVIFSWAMLSDFQ